jgi:PAS domain S-box-containing protein
MSRSSNPAAAASAADTQRPAYRCNDRSRTAPATIREWARPAAREFREQGRETQVHGNDESPAVVKRDGAVAIPNHSDILQAVIAATPDAIFVKDLDGRYVVVNAAFARFVGRPPADIIGKHDLELYPEDTARRFIADDQEVLAAGAARAFEGIATSATMGTQAYLVTKGVYRDSSGRIAGLFGISHDVTELRQANDALERTREALFRSQKMEAVGQLTGGLAHDFNNVLSVILGNLELLRLHVKADPYGCELIDTITRAALHAQDLTGNLLAFARGRPLNPQSLDINALIERMVRLLSRTLTASITVSTDLRDEARLARVDAAALEAAILNVVLNARDAMPDGGNVFLRTTRADISPESAFDLAAGPYAVVEVEDTGLGMSPDVVAHVFEPFFTTKNEGGTGLGLSMVHGFARQCGGTVSIASVPNRGTTVRIFLPLDQPPGR